MRRFTNLLRNIFYTFVAAYTIIVGSAVITWCWIKRFIKAGGIR